MTLSREKRYKQNPDKCFYCRSSNINKEFVSVDTGEIKFYVICNDCCKDWYDVYSLTEIEEIID